MRIAWGAGACYRFPTAPSLRERSIKQFAVDRQVVSHKGKLPCLKYRYDFVALLHRFCRFIGAISRRSTFSRD